MRPRQLGLVLIVIGVAGLTLTSIGWAAGPMGWMPGPRGMSSMYGWTHGSVEGASAAPQPSPGHVGDNRRHVTTRSHVEAPTRPTE